MPKPVPEAAPKPMPKRFYRGLALFPVLPFLMGFEPRRDEGLTVGVGAGAGRGHYSTGCAQKRYQQEYAAGCLSLDYTFAHDSARVYRPRVTVGGMLAAAGTDTRLIADKDADPEWLSDDERTISRRSAMAGALLRLDWAYLGLGAGGILAYPEWHQGNLESPAFPVAEARLGPWKKVFMRVSMGGGFAMPDPVPFDIAFGLGWQGNRFGAWLGLAAPTYEAPENLLTLSYRLRDITILGSVGMYLEDDGSYPGHYGFGDYSRAALGLRYGL